MTKIGKHIAAAALAGGFALSLAAFAQAQDQGAAPPAGPPGAHDGHHWDPAAMKAHMQERHQRRLQTLHDALGLRADQESAWQAFAADSGRGPEGRKPGGREHGQGGGQPPAPLTTPEKLDRMTHRMGEMQARLEKRAETVKRFYAALDPRQQKTFDALFAMRGHGGMGHHHEHGGDGGGAGWGR